MFKSSFFHLSIASAILFILNACTDANIVDSKRVFRYNEYRNVTSLDPAFARNPQNIWPINQLFNSLVQLDNQLKIQPEIASSWEISEDGMTYTFKLR